MKECAGRGDRARGPFTCHANMLLIEILAQYLFSIGRILEGLLGKMVKLKDHVCFVYRTYSFRRNQRKKRAVNTVHQTVMMYSSQK